MNSLILILFAVGLIFVFVKMTNKGQNVWSYIIVIAAIFFVITFVYVAAQPGVNLTTLEGLIHLSKLYFSWLSQIGGNLADITGNAVKLDWGARFRNATG